MPDRIVVNTGPLISLAAGGASHLLRELPHRFMVPREVVEEIRSGQRRGRPDIDLSHVTIVESEEPVDAVTLSLLDRGEAAVIQFALKNRITTVCIDEKKGRRIARAVDLEVVGTLGLLLQAKKLGLLAAIAPVIEKLVVHGVWYDNGLLESVLSSAGENLPEAMRDEGVIEREKGS
jgi:predicted nucleic acid-binding protein